MPSIPTQQPRLHRHGAKDFETGEANKTRGLIRPSALNRSKSPSVMQRDVLNELIISGIMKIRRID
jgi:hypothetical protein